MLVLEKTKLKETVKQSRLAGEIYEKGRGTLHLEKDFQAKC